MTSIIFLNGTSSAGKSTLAKAIRLQAEIPFWHVASDQFVEADMLPKRVNDGGAFDWSINRPLFFDAFHLCVKAILDAGNNIILDHIIESQEWFETLKSYLKAHDIFFVGVHCPLPVIQERERQRSDRDVGYRYLGEAEYHLAHVHTYSSYDFEVDTSQYSPQENARKVLNAWAIRKESIIWRKNG